MTINLRRILFYVGYILILSSKMFCEVKFINGSLNLISKLGTIILLILFIIQLFDRENNTIKVRTLFYLVILTLLSLISYFVSKDITVLHLFLLIATFKSDCFERFIKNDLKIKSFLLLLIISLYYLGLTNEVIIYRLNGSPRYGLGLGHPNSLGFYAAFIAIEYIYLNRNKSFVPSLILTSIFLIFIAKVTDCRTGEYILVLVFAMDLIDRLLKRKTTDNFILKFLVKNEILILTILSFVLIRLYALKTPIGINLNELFSDRLFWANQYLNYYPINIFGNNVFIPNVITKINGFTFFCVDNAFIFMILKFGLFFIFNLIILFKKMITNLFVKKESLLLLIFAILILSGTMETNFIRYNFNPFLLCLSTIFWNTDISMKKQEVQNENI